MKKVLVFGGTRFFGRKAVDKLVEKGYDVTIATRGNKKVTFGESVNHLIIDRSDASHEGWDKVSSQKWDVVLDNICFTKEDAEIAIDKLKGKVEHYFLTSTLAVYEGEKDGYVESDFDPWGYTFEEDGKVSYGEGKRQAEAVLFKSEAFPLVALRIPIVLGNDDYTERLHYYIRKILAEEPIHFYTPDAKISFIQASEAANVILWLIEHQKTGVYNASANEAVTIGTLMDWIEQEVARKAKVQYSESSAGSSPFSITSDKYLDVSKLTEEGYPLSDLQSWLKPLIRELKYDVQSDIK